MNHEASLFHPEWKRYAIAAALAVVAVLLERLVQAPAGMQFPGLVYAAIVATAWYGGIGPTLFAIVIGMLASWALLANGDAIPEAAAGEILLVFAVVAPATAAIVIALRRARDRSRRLSKQVRATERLAEDLRRTIDTLSERLVSQADWHAMTLRSIADAVVTTDAEGRVMSLNPAAEAWTGCVADRAHGVAFEQVVRLVDPDGCEDVAAALRDDLAAARVSLRDKELRLVHVDGSSRYVTVAGVPLVYHDGRRLGAVVTLHDVTSRREAVASQQALLDTARNAEQSARAAQLALEAAHEKFAAFMTNFPYPAFIQDENGAFVFVNRAGLASGTWREAAGIVDEHDAHPQTISLADVDRHYFSIRFPIAIEGKIWLGGIAIDISERIRAQSALSERTADFETLFDNVPAPLWIARDAAGTQVLGNAAVHRLLGVAGGERVDIADGGTAWWLERDGRRLEAERTPLRMALREGRVVPYTDVEIVRADGTRSHITVTAAPLLDAKGQVRGAVAAALDISQLKSYEAELERAVRRRDEFLAVLAHELRNPLAPIRNSVQILQKVPGDVERVRRATVTIDRQTSLLVRLIDDLLDVARISQGLVDLDIGPREVASIVSAATDAVRPTAESSAHEIVVHHQDASATMLVDGLRAEQIVGNLLANALKYSPPRTRVTVRSRVENGYVKISVADEGPGIPPAFMSQMFTMFARAAIPGRRRVGGLGVGLALARQLAQQQGGDIEAANQGPDGGATFTVWFPLARAAANAVR